jgi:hypothetical protein
MLRYSLDHRSIKTDDVAGGVGEGVIPLQPRIAREDGTLGRALHHIGHAKGSSDAGWENHPVFFDLSKDDVQHVWLNGVESAAPDLRIWTGIDPLPTAACHDISAPGTKGRISKLTRRTA